MSTLTYKDAGVDIDAGNELVRRIKPFAKATARPEVLGGLGGFGALFQLPLARYQQPILVSTTDGVGSKLKLAMAMKQHHTIGIDLVAMCVNDIIVQGAEPLFFLDYYATGQLSVDIAATVIESIAKGCEMAGCALVGGETAEMPGMYSGEDYDLAGFCVGIVEQERLIRPERVKAGDILLGLASSGAHSNGFSLVRKIIELSSSQLHMPFEKSTLGETLLAPTRIYVKSLLKLFEKITIHAAAHITGGGLLENVPRVLPPQTKAVIERNRWQRPAIFDWLQTQGNIADNEMFRTFNCGIGMVLAVDEKDAKAAIQLLTQTGETVWQIGVIESAPNSHPVILIV